MESDNLKDAYYVLLTGGKNNAGDFLIKHKAKKLLKENKPERKFIDYDAWKPLDNEKLDIVNDSQALLLTGGPALQYGMYPNVYKLTENLDDIKVPIIFFGVGWKSKVGTWEDTYNYSFTDQSRELLNRVFSNSYQSSVRDYHSQYTLENMGHENVLMTGCPALYELEYINSSFKKKNELNKILFSAGATQAKSKVMEKDQKEILLFLKNFFNEYKLKVVFHHSIDPTYLNTHNPNKGLYYKNRELAEWLNSKNISYVDISGSAEKLIDEYKKADFHIGYRVHAHIYMSSISKPSILLTEDGRGKGVKEILPGSVINGYSDYKQYEDSLLNRILLRFGYLENGHQQRKHLVDLIKKKMNTELQRGYPRLSLGRKSIDNHYQVMKEFIKQLP